MRIIAGQYRGRILKTVGDHSVRPATDRVRQVIFDILSTRLSLRGASVLDLFAGSGSLGIEALSRGAQSATFVELSPEARRMIGRNLEMIGENEAAVVVTGDALGFITTTRHQFDLIFADPPYSYELTRELPARIFAAKILHRDGYLVIEHAREVHFTSTSQYLVGPEKRFGRTHVTFFQGLPSGGGANALGTP